MASLMECETDTELITLKHDNFEKGDFWLLSDGAVVTIAQQRAKEGATQLIHVPKAIFDYLIKKYMEQQ